MDFELSKEQQDIQKTACEFAVGEFREIARDCDLNEEFPRYLLEKAGDLGFIGVFIDEEYGGAGLGFLEHALILEEFWKIDTKTVVMAKWFAARTAVEVVDEALQLHGGYGYINNHDIERFYKAAKVLEIYEGTKEIEKIIIAQRVLGKY